MQATANNQRLKVMLEGAMMAALATILSVVVPSIASFDIALGIVPIMLFSLKRGLKAGLYAGFLWGLLPILLGKAYVLTLWQTIVEYPLANMAVGLAGLYAPALKKALLARQNKRLFGIIALAALTGVGCKYLLHFYAGVIYWGKYAQWGLGPFLYSFVINGGSFVFNFIIAVIVGYIIFKRILK